MSKMQRLINQKYLDEIIKDPKQEEEQQVSTLLANLLEVNQLMVKFDEQIEALGGKILEFWSNLVNTKNTQSLFEKGIQITKELESLNSTYQEIDQKPAVKESKLYLQMAVFNKAVLFKESEYLREMMKSKAAIKMKKMINLTEDKEILTQKGLLLAKLHLTKPMTVQFINQTASDIFGYKNDELIGMAVNKIMP